MARTNVVPLDGASAAHDHTDAASAWRAIEAAQLFVKKTRDEINAAEKWIAIGVRFNELHAELDRISRHDKSAPGWNQAFADHKRFGMNAKTASKFSIIGKIFTGSESEPVKKLPAGWVALYLLASGFKNNRAELTLAIRNSEVTPLMTEREAKTLVAKHSPKVSKKKKNSETKSNELKATPMHNLDAARKDYAAKAKMLTSAERADELTKLATALNVKAEKTASKSKSDIPALVAALGTAVIDAGLMHADPKAHAARIEIVLDCIDCVSVDHHKLIKAYEKRLEKRGDLMTISIPKLTKK